MNFPRIVLHCGSLVHRILSSTGLHTLLECYGELGRFEICIQFRIIAKQALLLLSLSAASDGN
jgi:hypothetical protein